MGDSSTAKAMAIGVIVACLGLQGFEIIRPHGGLRWPFLDYPMYARAHVPGATVRTFRLRAETPDGRTNTVTPYDVGYTPDRFVEALRAAADGDRTERQHLQRVTRSACPDAVRLQVEERTLTTTARGVDRAAVGEPRWTARASWPIPE